MWFSASFGSAYVKLPRDLYSNKGLWKQGVKYVKEKHRPVPQQLLSTKAPDSNLHKPQVWILVILFTAQSLLQAVIGIKISFLFELMKRLQMKQKCSIIRHVATAGSSIYSRKEGILRTYSSSREEEKGLYGGKQRVNRKCSSLRGRGLCRLVWLEECPLILWNALRWHWGWCYQSLSWCLWLIQHGKTAADSVQASVLSYIHILEHVRRFSG